MTGPLRRAVARSSVDHRNGAWPQRSAISFDRLYLEGLLLPAEVSFTSSPRKFGAQCTFAMTRSKSRRIQNQRLASTGPSSGRETELYTLGGVRVVSQGVDETEKLGPRHVALMVYLYHEARPLHPSELVDLLGRGQDEEKELDRLSKAINWLRKNVRGVDISLSGDTVDVYGSVRLDTREVDAAIDGRDPERVAELYVGEFLEGFESGAPAFDEWAQRERGRLQRAWGNAMLGCAREAEHQREWGVAAHWWSVLVSRAPMRGDAVAGLLRAYARGARWEEAAEAYWDYADRLKGAGVSKVARPVTRVIAEHPQLKEIAKGRRPSSISTVAETGPESTEKQAPATTGEPWAEIPDSVEHPATDELVDATEPLSSAEIDHPGEGEETKSPGSVEPPSLDLEVLDPPLVPAEPQSKKASDEVADPDERPREAVEEAGLDVRSELDEAADPQKPRVTEPPADDGAGTAEPEGWQEFLKLPPADGESSDEARPEPDAPPWIRRAEPGEGDSAEPLAVDPLEEARAAARIYVSSIGGTPFAEDEDDIRHVVTSVRKPWGPALRSTWEELKPWIADFARTCLHTVTRTGRTVARVCLDVGRRTGHALARGPVWAGRRMAGLWAAIGAQVSRVRAAWAERAERRRAEAESAKVAASEPSTEESVLEPAAEAGVIEPGSDIPEEIVPEEPAVEDVIVPPDLEVPEELKRDEFAAESESPVQEELDREDLSAQPASGGQQDAGEPEPTVEEEPEPAVDEEPGPTAEEGPEPTVGEVEPPEDFEPLPELEPVATASTWGKWVPGSEDEEAAAVAVAGPAEETPASGRPGTVELLKRYWYAPVGLGVLILALLIGPGIARFVGDLSEDIPPDLAGGPVPNVTLPKVVVPKVTVRTPAFVETSVSRIGEMLSGPILTRSGEWLLVADVQVNSPDDVATGQGPPDSAPEDETVGEPAEGTTDSSGNDAPGASAGSTTEGVGRFDTQEVLPEDREPSPISAALTYALEADLKQARYYNVLPRERALRALDQKRAGHPQRLTVERALRLARLEGYGAVVAARVDRIAAGPDSVAIRVLSAEGDTVYGLAAEVGGDMTVLEALSGLSRAVKRRLGEPAAAVQASAPSTRLLTSSLPALESYAEARAHLYAGRHARAVRAARQAIRRDSTFAMAYRTLAEAYALQGLRPRARASLETAWELSDRLSERERYRLLADRLAWDGKYTDAALTYDELFQRYRDDAGALRSLALMQRSMGARGSGEGNLIVAYSIDPFDWPRLSELASYLGYTGALPDVDSLLATVDTLP